MGEEQAKSLRGQVRLIRRQAKSLQVAVVHLRREKFTNKRVLKEIRIQDDHLRKVLRKIFTEVEMVKHRLSVERARLREAAHVADLRTSHVEVKLKIAGEGQDRARALLHRAKSHLRDARASMNQLITLKKFEAWQMLLEE